MDIKVCLQNLGKYNEGELVFEWLELPATEEEIQIALENIGIGDEYEEYMIADYEAPIDLTGIASIEKLNEIAEALEDVEDLDFSDYSKELTDLLYILKGIAEELDMEDEVENYYTVEEVEDLELYLDSDGKVDLHRMYHFLGTFKGDTEVVRMDGYGNLCHVSRNELEDLYNSLLSSYLNKNF